MACGFLSDHRCELWVLFIPSRVKLASSVNTMNGINRRLAITHRHKSNRLASSPSSRRCTICRCKGHKPCWRDVRHTLLWNTDTCSNFSCACCRTTFCRLKNAFYFIHISFVCTFRRNMTAGKCSLTQFVVKTSKRSGISYSAVLYKQQEHFHYKTRKQIPYRHILHV